MAGQHAKRKSIVPESHKALDQMKYEIAAELGLPIRRYGGTATGALSGAGAAFDAEFAAEAGSGGRSVGATRDKETYWGFVSSRDAGAVGGRMTRKLVQQGEQDLFR